MAGNHHHYSDCESQPNQQQQQQQQNHNWTFQNGNGNLRSVSNNSPPRRSIPGPGATMQANDDFMQSPLVTWVRIFIFIFFSLFCSVISS